MGLVVDASAATAICLSDAGFALVPDELQAPVLLRSEVLSALQGLRWDVAYNARAGDEILVHYLEDFALPRAPRASAVELARSSYAMYNGGPAAARRWRDASPPAADAGFAEKLDAIRAGREADIERCYTG